MYLLFSDCWYARFSSFSLWMSLGIIKLLLLVFLGLGSLLKSGTADSSSLLTVKVPSDDSATEASFSFY